MGDSLERQGRTRQDQNPNLAPTGKTTPSWGGSTALDTTPPELFPPGWGEGDTRG